MSKIISKQEFKNNIKRIYLADRGAVAAAFAMTTISLRMDFGNLRNIFNTTAETPAYVAKDYKPSSAPYRIETPTLYVNADEVKKNIIAKTNDNGYLQGALLKAIEISDDYAPKLEAGELVAYTAKSPLRIYKKK